MKSLFVSAALAIMTIASLATASPAPNGGEYPDAEGEDEACPAVIDPVCCLNNRQTYQNACFAREAGCQQWTRGACRP